MNLDDFAKFSPVILRDGVSAVLSPDTIIASSPPHLLYYMPFEHIARSARLVIVGITPGPNQIEIAYAEVQRLLRDGRTPEEVLARVKAQAAFGGEAMRPNLLRMLRHFRFAGILGLDDEADLWGTAAHMMHATSVVAHAAFRNGRMFAGSFREVLDAPVLRKCFEDGFVASCAELPDDALYLGLGPTPLEALRHCVLTGAIRERQLLGALAHPSRNSGSQVDVYLGEKSPESLNPADPVRARAAWLREAYGQVRVSAERLGGLPASAACTRPAAAAVPSPAPKAASGRRPALPSRAGHPVGGVTAPPGLHYVVTRGKRAGTVLHPHVQDGHYVVSPTRFEEDYIRVPEGESLEPYLRRGLSLRMAAPGGGPASLISASSILGRQRDA